MNADSSVPRSDESAFLVPVRPPFDLWLTVSALRRLPHSLLYPLVEDELRFVAALSTGARLLGVHMDSSGATSHALQCRALDGPMSDAEIEEARRLVAWMLNVDCDLAPLLARVEGEEALLALARRLEGMKPPRFASLWEAFCQIVPFQLVSLQAAVATLNRFVDALGPRIEHDGQVYLGAPTPEQVVAAETSQMRACGLSVAKIQTLRGLAERAIAGELDGAVFERLSDAESIARLTRLPGIGPWSAQVALLRGLGRLSVFPAGDSGATRALRQLLADSAHPDAEAAALLGRLGEWRGYLYFMLLGRRLLAAPNEAS